MTVRVVGGQVVLIAGGGLGTGALVARAAAQAGATAIIAQRGTEGAVLPGPVGTGTIRLADAETRSPAEICEAAGNGARRLDALVYSAAPALVSPYWQLDEAAWGRGVTDPLLDAHRWARAALLEMREQRYGKVILIGPPAGLEPNDDRVATSTLGGALRGLAESLAYAGLRFNVQTYAIRLGARPVDLGHAPEVVWPELGPRLVDLLGGRLDVASGGLVDIGAAGD